VVALESDVVHLASVQVVGDKEVFLSLLAPDFETSFTHFLSRVSAGLSDVLHLFEGVVACPFVGQI